MAIKQSSMILFWSMKRRRRRERGKKRKERKRKIWERRRKELRVMGRRGECGEA